MKEMFSGRFGGKDLNLTNIFYCWVSYETGFGVKWKSGANIFRLGVEYRF